MTRDEIIENIDSGIRQVVAHIPKQWDNVQAVHIKTTDSIALPLYARLPEIPTSIPVEGSIKETTNPDNNNSSENTSKSKKEEAEAPTKERQRKKNTPTTEKKEANNETEITSKEKKEATTKPSAEALSGKKRPASSTLPPGSGISNATRVGAKKKQNNLQASKHKNTIAKAAGVEAASTANKRAKSNK